MRVREVAGLGQALQQELAEEVVVPVGLGAQRNQEQPTLVEGLQGDRRVGAGRQGLAARPVQPGQGRRREQEGALGGLELGEHLAGQVIEQVLARARRPLVSARPVAAPLGDELQGHRPPLGLGLQAGHLVGVRRLAEELVEEVGDLVGGKSERVLLEGHDVALEPPAGQVGQVRPLTRGEHDVEPGHAEADQVVDQRQRVRRVGEQVEVVQHQPGVGLQVVEQRVGQSLDRRGAVARRTAGQGQQAERSVRRAGERAVEEVGEV
ncbi:hypothetical protein D3C72_790600 [compost metagenome]